MSKYSCRYLLSRFGTQRVSAIAIILLLVSVGACSVQIYVLSEENLVKSLSLDSLRRQTAELKKKQDLLMEKVNSIEIELAKYRLRRPTYAELQEFLTADQIDKRTYVKEQYVCVNFAADLKHSAAGFGYNISFVTVNFDAPDKSGGHALNGAYLSDGSWVWIEPQTDSIHWGTIEQYLKSFFDVEWVKVETLAIVW